jgi:hypothetical protein
MPKRGTTGRADTTKAAPAAIAGRPRARGPAAQAKAAPRSALTAPTTGAGAPDLERHEIVQWNLGKQLYGETETGTRHAGASTASRQARGN